MSYAIQTNLLTKRFGSTTVLQDVSLQVEENKIYALLGANGAGKSTLLQILATLLTPTSGKAKILGMDLQREKIPIKKKVGILFGSDTGLYERFTAYENISIFANFYGISNKEQKEQIESWSEKLGLSPYLHKPAGQLSKGNKQKTAIIRALIHDPDVLFFDEPTTGLDIESSFQFQDIVRQLHDRGKTILFSTHILEEVTELAQAVSVLRKGKLIYSGTLKSLYLTYHSNNLVKIMRKLIGRQPK